jgi:hypothetical protein
MSELSAEVREAYKFVRKVEADHPGFEGVTLALANALRDERARVLWYEHEVTIPWHNGPCEKCNREFEQWQAEADAELMGEKP